MDKLISLGLTKNQAKVYRELVVNPKQSAGQLAKQLSIDRSFMYGILKSLNNKGLVSVSNIDGKTAYVASAPENLLLDLEEKKAIAKSAIDELKKISCSSSDNSINIFQGKEGLKILAREIIKERSFDLMGGGNELITLEKLEFEYPHIVKVIQTKRVRGRMLVSKRNYGRLNKILTGSNVEIKPIKKKPSRVNFVIFGNKLALFSAFSLKTIIVQDKEFAEGLKSYFENLWNYS